ncbi:hypothetical protein BN2537_16209 [Streptomyces venezuelae]|nr:hypothetical protein BN2537_16209 [Streptomyces venezuelae]
MPPSPRRPPAPSGVLEWWASRRRRRLAYADLAGHARGGHAHAPRHPE